MTDDRTARISHHLLRAAGQLRYAAKAAGPGTLATELHDTAASLLALWQHCEPTIAPVTLYRNTDARGPEDRTPCLACGRDICTMRNGQPRPHRCEPASATP